MTKYNSVKEMRKSMEEKDLDYKKKHPILWKTKQIYYALYRFWKYRICYIHKEIQWFFQRGKRGFSDSDIWGFDYYLAKVIYNGLKQLKETSHGCGATLNPKTGKRGFSERRWDRILDKMIKGFKLIADIGEGKREIYLPEIPKDVRKENKCLTKREDSQIKEAFDLFKENYFNLWD